MKIYTTCNWSNLTNCSWMSKQVNTYTKCINNKTCDYLIQPYDKNQRIYIPYSKFEYDITTYVD